MFSKTVIISRRGLLLKVIPQTGKLGHSCRSTRLPTGISLPRTVTCCHYYEVLV